MANGRRFQIRRLREIIIEGMDLVDELAELDRDYLPADESSIEELQVEAQRWVDGNPWIVGFGVGPELADKEESSNDAELVLRVYVTNEAAAREDPEYQIPESIKTEIPEIDEVRVEIVEIGEPRLLQAICPNPNTQPMDQNRPLRPGCSISIEAINDALMFGTLTALVTRNDADDESRYLLSNSHVIASAGLSPAGTSVYQPGSCVNCEVARLDTAYPVSQGIENYFDAAIARVNDGIECRNYLRGIGPVNSDPIELVDNMLVLKSGAFSQVSCGYIFDPDAYVYFYWPTGLYDTEKIKFKKQILVASNDVDISFSTSGDSGSLVVDRDNLSAIGILMGETYNFDGISSNYPVAVCNNTQLLLEEQGLSVIPVP